MTTTYESADLVLKLYDLRREAVMRRARAWFREQFHPETAAEVLAVYRGKSSAPYRMVTTYWNMAAALVLHGAIDAQMFADTTGEHLMVYARLEPFLPQLRAALKHPAYLDHLEKLILQMPDAQARIARMRRRRPAARPARNGHDGAHDQGRDRRPDASEYAPPTEPTWAGSQRAMCSSSLSSSVTRRGASSRPSRRARRCIATRPRSAASRQCSAP